jgi:hypothetical protein
LAANNAAASIAPVVDGPAVVLDAPVVVVVLVPQEITDTPTTAKIAITSRASATAVLLGIKDLLSVGTSLTPRTYPAQHGHKRFPSTRHIYQFWYHFPPEPLLVAS